MNNTGYLGGWQTSWEQRHALIQKHLAGRPTVDLGLRAQCRCGETEYTVKWGRHYCIRCGRFVRRFSHLETSESET